MARLTFTFWAFFDAKNLHAVIEPRSNKGIVLLSVFGIVTNKDSRSPFSV
jgi:hypothetical protein